MDNIY